ADGGRCVRQGCAQRRLRDEQTGFGRLGSQAWPVAGRVLRRDALRLGATRGQRGEIRRKRRGRRDAFSRRSSRSGRVLIQERHVAGLAVDTLSLDHGPSKDFKTHTIWLPAGRWGIENIANLDKVPASGATLVVGAAKVKDATGGPARVFA